MEWGRAPDIDCSAYPAGRSVSRNRPLFHIARVERERNADCTAFYLARISHQASAAGPQWHASAALTHGIPGVRTERTVAMCRAAGATHYLSRPTAREHLNEAPLTAAGVSLEWMDYAGCPDYPQLWGAFVPAVSVLDRWRLGFGKVASETSKKKQY